MISFVIKNDPAGLIKTRQTADNIRLVVNLKDLNKYKVKFVIFSLDVETPFDKNTQTIHICCTK